MMQPKRSKFRKAFKGRIHGNAKGGFALNFGEFGLKAMEPERVTARQIEAARRALTRHMKRAGRVWIRVFPDVPVSKKPIEVRMGKGKGAPEWWIARVAPGRIMFEIDGVPESLAREAFSLAAAKLPIKTRFVQRIAELGRLNHENDQPSFRPSRHDRRSAHRRGAQAQERAVQPAIPEGERTIARHCARARRAA
jgi:large subunit ribosomal protein L16